MTALPDWALEALKNQSPTVIVVLFVAGFLFRHIAAQHKDHLQSKDKEIERLVKERDKLQDRLLKERLSTDTPSPDKGKKK